MRSPSRSAPGWSGRRRVGVAVSDEVGLAVGLGLGDELAVGLAVAVVVGLCDLPPPRGARASAGAPAVATTTVASSTLVTADSAARVEEERCTLFHRRDGTPVLTRPSGG